MGLVCHRRKESCCLWLLFDICLESDKLIDQFCEAVMLCVYTGQVLDLYSGQSRLQSH
jgi:hypothetical protein